MMYLVVVFIALIMMIVEKIFPAQQLEMRSFWWLRTVIFNSMQVLSALSTGFLWDHWMQKSSILHIETYCGKFTSVLLGYLCITFVYYWWHRARHESDFLWRWLHQLHHSPQRLEVITSFYKHPLEIVLNSIISSTVLYLLLGLSPMLGAVTTMVTGIAEFIYHWNIRTPYWLGYIFQRPESHRIHHQENWHKNNYSDLPLWDILFGTFQNPKDRNISCGFTGNKELRILDLLTGVDVHGKK